MITALTLSSILLWVSNAAIIYLLARLLKVVRPATNAQDVTELAAKGTDVKPLLPLTGVTLEGRSWIVESLPRATALFFITPGCKPCENALPGIAKNARDIRAAGLEAFVLSAGNWQETRTYLSEKGIEIPAVSVEDAPFLEGLGVNTFPTAYLIDSEGSLSYADIVKPTGLDKRHLDLWIREHRLKLAA